METLLAEFGFTLKPGKGSHEKWIKSGLPPIVVASHDKDVQDYLIKQVIRVLQIGGLL